MTKETTPLSLGELSEAEREALIEAGELEPGPDDQVDLDAAGADDDADGADGADDDGADDSAGEDDAAAAAGDNDAAAPGDADGDDAPPQPAAPRREVPDHTARVSEIEDRVAAINEERAALRQQLDEGDIRLAEFHEKYEPLSDELIDLKAERRDLNQDTQRVQNDAEAEWLATQDRVFGEPENAIYRVDGDPVMRAALGTQLEVLGKQYQEQGVDPGGEAILREAIAKVSERFAPKDAASPPARNARADRGRQQAAAQQDTPQTLRNVPAAAEADESLSDDEFAELDAMLGDPDRMMEAEARIARMPYHEQQRFGTVTPR